MGWGLDVAIMLIYTDVNIALRTSNIINYIYVNSRMFKYVTYRKCGIYQLKCKDGRKHVWEQAGHIKHAMGSACRQLQQIGIAQNTTHLTKWMWYRNVELALESVYERSRITSKCCIRSKWNFLRYK